MASTDHDSGQVAGVEAVAFGALILVVGSLIILNAWMVLDARLAVDAAAREATRAYVEATPAAGDAEALRAANAAISGQGRDPARLILQRNGIAGQRCASITFTASYALPAVRLPFVGNLGSGITVRAHHSERLDPYAARPGLTGGARCG